MAEFKDLLTTESIKIVFNLIAENSESVTLSVVGIILILTTIVLAYKAVTSNVNEIKGWLKATLFICLIGGIFFSFAGPALTVLGLSRDREKGFVKELITPEMGLSRLHDNAEVQWLIRLIPYNPTTEPKRALNRLTHLGRPGQRYTFVADYTELRGNNAEEAVFKLGGSMQMREERGDSIHVSAIIFPRRGRRIYPANARGLLQVIHIIDASRDLNSESYLPFNIESELNRRELADLKNTSDRGAWSWPTYKEYYKTYCELAQNFRCSGQPYTAKSLIGELSRDWHPIGLSQRLSSDKDLCRVPNAPCEISSWEQTSGLRDSFGARVFLIENLELTSINGRIMIHFHDPKHQKIPDIGI